jgi:hypothetical protein
MGWLSRKSHEGKNCWTHSFFQLGILVLSVDKILDDIEGPREDKREEQAESCEVHVALRA